MSSRKEKQSEKQTLKDIKSKSLIEDINELRSSLEEEKLPLKNSNFENHDDGIFTDDSKEEIKMESDEEYTFEKDYELLELLKCNTDQFTITYAQAKTRDIFINGALSFYDKGKIKRIIQQQRQNLKRERREKFLRTKDENRANKNLKRVSAIRIDEENDKRPLKKQKLEKVQMKKEDDYFQARFFIDNYSQFEFEFQNTILKAIEDLIQKDDNLKTTIQEQMIMIYSKKANALYESGDIKGLIQMLQVLPPNAAILINIQISLKNEHYTEESHTLQQTLLPFLDQVLDYSFISQNSQFTMQRFIKSLYDHIIDKQSKVGQGFILCALKYEPSRLQQIIPYVNNKEHFINALLHMNFSQQISQLIIENYTKLFWPQLLQQLYGKLDSLIFDTLQVIKRMNIISDPGIFIGKLLSLFSQRSLIAEHLLKNEEIQIGLQTLIRIIEILMNQSKETIIATLSQDSHKWEQMCTQNSSKGEIQNSNAPIEFIMGMYDSMTKEIEKRVDLNIIQDISKNLSQEINIYKHCEYQSAIAAIIASHNNPFIIAISPTGSGKTWIQGLLAKYYCNIEKLVTILEPNEELKRQTIEKLSQVDYMIQVMTVEEYYTYGSEADVIIVNEYDMVISEQPYFIREGKLVGIWNLKSKHIIAFSATTSNIFERLVNNCIVRPKVLKFKSEFEIQKGLSPIQEPELINCKDDTDIENQLIQHIEKQYEKKPIIIIYDQEQEQQLLNLIKSQNYTYYEGPSEATLEQLKNLDYGIHLLESKFSRGIDIRFKVDSIVFIVAEVKTYHQLMQMVGRSSRTRGVCESTLFAKSMEKSSMLFQRLQRVGISEMNELEKLIQLFEKKSDDQGLQQVVKASLENKKMISSIKGLQEIMSSDKFEKLFQVSIEKPKRQKKK